MFVFVTSPGLINKSRDNKRVKSLILEPVFPIKSSRHVTRVIDNDDAPTTLTGGAFDSPVGDYEGCPDSHYR